MFLRTKDGDGYDIWINPECVSNIREDAPNAGYAYVRMTNGIELHVQMDPVKLVAVLTEARKGI